MVYVCIWEICIPEAPELWTGSDCWLDRPRVREVLVVLVPKVSEHRHNVRRRQPNIRRNRARRVLLYECRFFDHPDQTVGYFESIEHLEESRGEVLFRQQVPKRTLGRS